MRNLFARHNHQEAPLVSWRDLQSAIIGMTVALIALLVILMSQDQKKANEETDKNTGNIRVEILWPNEMDVDIDLWCKAPGDIPVGYSNKGGLVFNLVRDDLGLIMDTTGMNYEVMFARGNPPGEYICNVHWYSNTAKVPRVPVRMIITYRRDDKARLQADQVIDTTVNLLRVGEEVTMARWTLNAERLLMKDSINAAYYPLREFKPEPGR